MGTYINKGNNGFRISRNSEYVDKSGLIAVINATLDTKLRFTCVSRCRRFGKSMAAEMLAAYYDQSCDSHELFVDLEIAHDPQYERHLNKYPVIYVDMTGFVSRFKDSSIVNEIQKRLLSDISATYHDIDVREGDDLMDYLASVVSVTKQHFILIIDEWDAILREFGQDNAVKDSYVDFLRRMFKDTASEVFAAVYMTGILPVKKYKTQSALNNFTEYSMLDPKRMSPYFGFTKKETMSLCVKYGMDFDEMEKWYDGYQIGSESSMFNPNSVMQALYSDWCTSYWGKTAAYDAISPYIKMNFNGLKDDILNLLAGGRVKVNTAKFQNDISVVETKDDVLTLLIHLGYLSFDRVKSECHVPNYEVAEELKNAVEDMGWSEVVKSLQQSEQLLEATLHGDAERVAHSIGVAHDENTSILSYNDENSLACVLSIAYYCARKDYVMHRELATGKGFADLVLMPRKNVDSPAIIIELKCDKDVDSAIDQIKRKQYPDKVMQYLNLPLSVNNSQLSSFNSPLLLVGINYDRKSKKHTCRIEKWEFEK